MFIWRQSFLPNAPKKACQELEELGLRPICYKLHIFW